MTPGARVAAAIEILDDILRGTPTERALTSWARSRRFAGSKDRAAIRDHVFDAVRNLRSYAWAGGLPWPETTGRAVMLGALRTKDLNVADFFSGQGHAPAPTTSEETIPPASVPDSESWNMPDTVRDLLETSLGSQARLAAKQLAERAPVTVRANLAKVTLEVARTHLERDGIFAKPNPLSACALTVQEGARKIQISAGYLAGYVELQDASSQAVVEFLPLRHGLKVLDYCAGGGGKSLALAMHTGTSVWAHDIDPARMRDIPNRAARAGADIRVLNGTRDLPKDMDLVFVDAPCSGSGSWRRAPDAKWAFSRARLAELTALQDRVLDAACKHVGPGGMLAYATCSVFADENAARVDAFVERHQGMWREVARKNWAISEEGDGFFCVQLMRE